MGWLLGTILLAVQLVLIARIILDWTTVFVGPPPIGGFRHRATEVVVNLTEPLLAPVRRLVPPLRIGAVSLDLAFIIVFLTVVILRSIVTRF